MNRRRSTALLLLCPMLVVGCIPLENTNQGEDFLGDYAVIGSSLEDSCLSTRFQASLSFPVKLSRTKELLYFGGPGGTLHGTLAGQTFTVSFGGIETFDSRCRLGREETITATLGERSLSGTYLIRVIPEQGFSCASAVTGPTRQFAVLPCSVRYQLTGERTDEPDGGSPVDGGAPDAGASDGGTP